MKQHDMGINRNVIEMSSSFNLQQSMMFTYTQMMILNKECILSFFVLSSYPMYNKCPHVQTGICYEDKKYYSNDFFLS